MPKVSVVVPNYNHARYLPERMASVLGQTFADFEVILCDDCSTDDSRDVIGQVARTDRRVRTCFNTVNSGSGYRQWNRGVGEAVGEYVWIAESDDSADPELLRTLVGLLDAHPRVGVAYCQSLRIDERGECLGSMAEWTSDIPTDRWHVGFVGNGVDECRRYLCLKNTIPNASAILFRRSVFQAAGGAPDTFRLCADWLLWATMLTQCDVAFTPEPLNRFRFESQSVTQSRKKDGTNAEESYRVARAIEALTGIAPDALETARQNMFYVWTHPLLAGEVFLSPSRANRIYREARAFDPQIHPRLMRFLAQYIRVKTRQRLALPSRKKGMNG